MVRLGSRECETGADVFGLKIRIVGENLLLARARREEVEDVAHADAQAPNTRPSAALLRVEGDALHRGNIGLIAFEPKREARALRCSLAAVTWWERIMADTALELAPGGMPIEEYDRLGEIPPYNDDVRRLPR
jgi:hypothetical protein